ncbi:hypothetical protein ACFL6C_01775 [Myxococcota bacterium]
MLPRSLLVALRRRLETCFFEDVGGGCPPDVDPQASQGITDLGVAPARVVLGDPDDEPANICGRSRTARAPLVRAIVFLGHELPKPGEDGRRLDDLTDRSTLFWGEVFAEDGETPPLGIGEGDALLPGECVDNLLEHADLCLGVVELLLHPVVDGAGKDDDQEIERGDELPDQAPLCDNGRLRVSGQCAFQSTVKKLRNVSHVVSH